jgi:hypothetical protein
LFKLIVQRTDRLLLNNCEPLKQEPIVLGLTITKATKSDNTKTEGTGEQWSDCKHQNKTV